MEEETKIVTKENPTSTTTSHKHAEESQMFGVSVRGWLAFLLVSAIIYNKMAITTATLYYAIKNSDFALVGSLTTIDEPLYSLSIAALGYYFGAQKMKGAMMAK